jgi:hypothetical protein
MCQPALFHGAATFRPISASIVLALIQSVRLSANADPGEGMENPKNIQEPQDSEYDHDCVQEGLDGSCHGNEVVHQPEQNTNHDERHQDVD